MNDDVLGMLDALLEDRGGDCFGEDFLWVLLATKEGLDRAASR
jgi:hypothetical protein